MLPFGVRLSYLSLELDDITLKVTSPQTVICFDAIICLILNTECTVRIFESRIDFVGQRPETVNLLQKWKAPCSATFAFSATSSQYKLLKKMFLGFHYKIK